MHISDSILRHEAGSAAWQTWRHEQIQAQSEAHRWEEWPERLGKSHPMLNVWMMNLLGQWANIPTGCLMWLGLAEAWWSAEEAVKIRKAKRNQEDQEKKKREKDPPYVRTVEGGQRLAPCKPVGDPDPYILGMLHICMYICMYLMWGSIGYLSIFLFK